MRPARVCIVLVLLACQDEYPLPPTACDDFCHATQRAACPEDYPEGCVSECEDDAVLAVHPGCQAAWDARNRCYLGAPRERFECAEGRSVPSDELCLDERQNLLSCVRPEAEPCLLDCFRRRRACGGSTSDCDAECANQDPTCGPEERAYYACAANHEVDCTEGEEERPIEEIPCLAEIGAWFDCLGWE